MMETQLFFGRDIPGRAQLTDAEWAAFAARMLTPNFPGGFTVSDGDGAWRDPSNGATITEQTKIVMVASPTNADMAGSDMAVHIAAVTNAYKVEFHQQSVGILQRSVCGAF